MRITKGMVDENTVSFNINYFYTKGALSASNWKTNTQLMTSDPPDEFAFNFMGYTGSFFLDHNNSWQVKSQQGLKMKIEVETTPNLTLVNVNTNNTFITKFSITDAGGTRYIFGGDLDAVEFNVPQTLLTANPPDQNIYSNAWQLKQIVYPNKRVVDFEYERKYSRIFNTYSDMSDDDLLYYPKVEPEISQPRDINVQNSTILFLSVLKKIKIDNLATILLTNSLSNELKPSPASVCERYITFHNQTGGWTPNSYTTHYGFAAFDMASTTLYYKLDNVKVLDMNNKEILKVDFEYIENPTERLKLQKVKFSSSANAFSEYNLEYNALKLPAYGVAQEDHWGFYNGKNYWNSQHYCGSMISAADVQHYYPYREPDPAFMQAEMLTKITYPTKGYSEFYYEPHTYSKVVKQNPITLQDNSTDKIAGGLRIKKIVSSAGPSALPLTKEYFYINDFINNGTRSSGVLSGEPVYYEAGEIYGGSSTFTFRRFSSNSLNYLHNTNGNHVTYTECIEKNSDAGYTVTRFTNHDNGYLDHPPFFIQSNGWTPYDMNIVQKQFFGSLAHERGLVKYQGIYNKDKVLLEKSTYEYNDDPDRYLEYVRGYSNQYQPASVSALVTFPVYTFWPFLKSEDKFIYDNNGTELHMSKIYAYDYANRLKISEKTFDSKGNNTIIFTLYSSSFSFTEPYITMIQRNMLNAVVSQEVKRNGFIIQSTEVDYDFYSNGSWGTNNAGSFILPRYEKSSSNGLPLELRTELKKYTQDANVAELVTRGGPVSSNLYEYNGQYPIAVVLNSQYNQAFATSFESEEGEYWGNEGVWYNDAVTGKRCMNLYENGYVIVDKPFPAGSYRFSFWMKGTTDPTVSAGTIVSSNKTLMSNGWYLCTYNITLNGTQSVGIFAATGNDLMLDEVRVAPVHAQMKTYTYDPLVGITTEMDANHRITYYEYDSNNRLILVRDQDKKVIKKYCYNYSGQPVNCN